MELVSLAKEVLQSAAETAASFRPGQVVLRQLDRALWVVEKTAKWAVPPPLDQDERPAPELIRPLPWVFFLALLVTLRVSREAISLFNLVVGKPPLRSADVVMYIQSRRRYLRTLKYQGNRVMRSRAASRGSWRAAAKNLLQFTMCFSRPQCNNNTTVASNNDEVLVSAVGAAAAAAGSMERLLEQMMLDRTAADDDDSSYTLTNATSGKSDSDLSESDHDTCTNSEVTFHTSAQSQSTTSLPSLTSSTPNKEPGSNGTPASDTTDYITPFTSPESTTKIPKPDKTPKIEEKSMSNGNDSETGAEAHESFVMKNDEKVNKEKRDSENLIKSEKGQKTTTAKKAQKLANGRTIENSQTKKRDGARPHRNN